MSIMAGQYSLQESHKVLRLQWDEARASWMDGVARRFAEETIEPLDRQVRKAAAAMGQLSEAVEAAKRECS
jgi:hypothetical protein